METGPVSGSGASAAQKPKPQQSLGQEDFLRLMTTQLQNQDPFKPMESAEFLSQIAQFSTVTGIQELNRSFADLSSALTSEQTLQGAALVGRNALVQTDAVRAGHGAPVGGLIELDREADVTVEVYDPAGQLVRQIPLGHQPAGAAAFQWDGLANDGSELPLSDYSLTARVTADGQTAAAPLLLQGRIDSVSLGGNGGLSFNIAGLGSIAFSDVRQIN